MPVNSEAVPYFSEAVQRIQQKKKTEQELKKIRQQQQQQQQGSSGKYWAKGIIFFLQPNN